MESEPSYSRVITQQVIPKEEAQAPNLTRPMCTSTWSRQGSNASILQILCEYLATQVTRRAGTVATG